VIALNPNSPMGEGGEAQVFVLPQDATLLAKIYRKPTNAHAAKLVAMLNNPPLDPTAAQGHISIAWPVDLLRTVNSNHIIVGFIMPCVTGMHRISDFYNPRARRQRCPVFNYYYLHHTAYNLAVAVRTLHDCGYVICDLNESNVLVSDTALVTLIDTDSFQVRDPYTGVVYRGPVATSAFTPPELQGKTFSQIDRTAEHDLFALGVLIFQLLMEGTHPFTGVFQGFGEVPSYEKRILSGHFPYSTKKSVPYRPTPNAPPFNLLHPALQKLFVSCFEDGHDDPQARPDAQAWQAALIKAENSLITCPINDQHLYGDHLPGCPWCERTTQLNGHDPFPARQKMPKPIIPPPTQTPLPSAWTLLPQKQLSRLLAYFRQPRKIFQLLIMALLAMTILFGLQYGYKRWFDPSIYIKEGDAFYEKGDYDQAILNYNKAIEIDRESADAYLHRGRAYNKKGELKKAEDDFTKTIELKPNFADAYKERGILYYNKYQKEKSQTALKKSMKAKAVEDLAQAIKYGQNDSQSYYYRGDLFSTDEDDFNIAIDDFTNAIKINPNFAEAYTKRAAVYDRLIKYDLALSDYSALIRINQDDIEAYKKRGSIYYKKREYDKAIADFDQAIKRKSTDAYAYFFKGKIFVEMPNPDLERALQSLGKALEQKKYLQTQDLADMYFYYGIVYEKQEHYTDAIDNYTEAIRLDPNAVEKYKRRAMLYEQLYEQKDDKRWASKALDDYKQLIKLKPDDIDNYKKCARLSEVFKQWGEAVKFYTKIIEYDSDDAEAYCRRGICYLRLKDISRADEDLQKVDQNSDCYGEAKALREQSEKKQPPIVFPNE